MAPSERLRFFPTRDLGVRQDGRVGSGTNKPATRSARHGINRVPVLSRNQPLSLDWMASADLTLKELLFTAIARGLRGAEQNNPYRRSTASTCPAMPSDGWHDDQTLTHLLDTVRRGPGGDRPGGPVPLGRAAGKRSQDGTARYMSGRHLWPGPARGNTSRPQATCRPTARPLIS